MNFADDTRQPWTPAFFDSLYNGPAQSVRDFYERSSQGQVTAQATVTPWLQTATPVSPCNLLATSDQADALSGYDLSQFDNRTYLFPANTCLSAGRSEMPGTRSWIGMPVDSSCPDPNAGSCQHFHIFPHELAHAALGLDHAASYICTSGGVHVVLSDTCTQQEYGDQFSTMGCCSPALFNNVERAQVGWIPAPVIVSQSATLTVAPTFAAGAPLYAIPLGDGTFLYLENRAFEDVYGPGAEGGVWPNGNLLIRRAPAIDTQGRCVLPGCFAVTQLLDGSPADNDTIPNAKGLPVGQGFTYAGLTITNLGWDGTNNSVGVVYN